MKTAKQKIQRKDYKKKHNINNNLSDNARAKHKGFVQPYPGSRHGKTPKKKV